MPNTRCQNCKAESQLFLCSTCQFQLRHLLIDLTRGGELYIGGTQPTGRRGVSHREFLEDARYGMTRLGASARRSTEWSRPALARLNGDPDAKDSFKGTPLELHRKAHATAARWVQEICETRGITFVPLNTVGHRFIGPLRPGIRRLPRNYTATFHDMASWLATHTDDIALDRTAGQCLRDFQRLVDDIESMINRPKPPRRLGPCPTMVGRRQQCSTQLEAHRDAETVTCPVCKTTHTVGHMLQLLYNFLQYEPLSSVEILGSRTSELPGALETLERGIVARSTFHFWRKQKWLQPRAFRTNTGAVSAVRQDDNDVQLYWLADVYQLMAENAAEKRTKGA